MTTTPTATPSFSSLLRWGLFFIIHALATSGYSVSVGSAPTYSSSTGYIGEQFFTIFFDNALDSANPPALTQFQVLVNGTEISATSLQFDSETKSVRVNLNATTLLPGDIIDFVYTDPTAGNDANALQGSTGLDVASISHSLIVAITRPLVTPTVTGVTSSTPNGTYRSGSSVSVQVTFSEAVTVSGMPQLTLETGTTDRVVNYASGSGSSTLTFSYTVQTGDISGDLDYASTSALALNSGTITATSGGTAASLTLSATGAAGSLGANKALLIDGVLPTASIVVTDTSLTHGETSLVTITFSEAVTGFANEDLTIANGSLTTVSSSDGGTTWIATLNPTANLTDATNVITLDNTGVTDAAGNAGTGTTDSSNYAINTVVMPDYTVTTAGGVLTVTDVSGNGDTLAVSEPGSGRISFLASDRTFSVDGGSIRIGSGQISLTGITSIVINAAAGADTISLSSFTTTGGFPALTINGGQGDDVVSLGGDITFASDASLDVDLQNDDSAPGLDSFTMYPDANLAFGGTGSMTVKTSGGMNIGNSRVGSTSVDVYLGSIILEANQQAVPSSFNDAGGSSSSMGILVGRTALRSGGGNIVIKGKHGAEPGRAVFVSGVQLVAVTVQSTGAGTVTIEGTGPATTVDNRGITLTSACTVSSLTGDITLTGTAGQGSSSTGVSIEGGSQVLCGGTTAKVTITGTGGQATSSNSTGIILTGTDTKAFSGGGDLTVNGMGGTSAALISLGVNLASSAIVETSNAAALSITGQAVNGARGSVGIQNAATLKTQHGAMVLEGEGGNVSAAGVGSLGSVGVSYTRGTLASTGEGAISITGRSGDSNSGSASMGVYILSQIITGSGGLAVNGTSRNTVSGSYLNFGVSVSNITATGGAISLTGTGGVPSSRPLGEGSHGVVVAGILNADSITLTGTSADTTNNEAIGLAPMGTATLNAPSITLIGDSMFISTTDATLNAGTTGTVTLYPRTAGAQIIIGSAPVPADSRLAALSLPLIILHLKDAALDRITASTLTIGDSRSRSITVQEVVSPASYKTLVFGKHVTFAATGGFASDVASTTDYEKLTVEGTATISAGATLTMASTGDFVASSSNSFSLLTNDLADAISGTFTGPTLESFLGSTLTARQSYTGGTGNDLVISLGPPEPLVIPTTITSFLTLNVNTGLLEGIVRVTNDSPFTLDGIRLFPVFAGAPHKLWNPTFRGGNFIEVIQTIAPAGTVDIPVKIYSTSRTLASWKPIFRAEAITETSIDPVNVTRPAVGGSYDIAVTTASIWPVIETLPWATVSTTQGVGSGPLTVTLAPNPTAIARTGTIKIGAKTHTVTQSGILAPAFGELPNQETTVSAPFTLALPILNGPFTVTQTGLPPGLTLNPTTGVITGKATRAGTFLVNLKAVNVAAPRGVTASFTLLVNPLPTSVIGSYHGSIARSEEVYLSPNPMVGARIEFTTQSNGSLTGKIIEGATVVLLNGTLNASVPSAPIFTANLVAAGVPLTLSLTLNGNLCAVQLTSDATTVEGQAWRNTWTATRPATAYAIRHNFLIDPVPTVAPSGRITPSPRGYGFGNVTPSSVGAAVISGQLPDGSIYTTSTFVGPNGEVLVYQPLYQNKGSVLGRVSLLVGKSVVPKFDPGPRPQDNLVSGLLSWHKPSNLVATDTVYKAGFTLPEMSVEGGAYVPPAAGQLVLGLPAVVAPETNAQISFLDGGLPAGISEGLRISAPATVAFAGINAQRVSLVLNPATGQMTGSFTLPGSGPMPVRTVNFYGILTRSSTGFTGQGGFGFFLLPAVPVPPQTLNTVPKESGAVELTATGTPT